MSKISMVSDICGSGVALEAIPKTELEIDFAVPCFDVVDDKADPIRCLHRESEQGLPDLLETLLKRWHFICHATVGGDN